MIWVLDACYLSSHYLSYNTSLKMQTQGSKKFKPKDLKPALLHDNTVEPAK